MFRKYNKCIQCNLLNNMLVNLKKDLLLPISPVIIYLFYLIFTLLFKF